MYTYKAAPQNRSRHAPRGPRDIPLKKFIIQNLLYNENMLETYWTKSHCLLIGWGFVFWKVNFLSHIAQFILET